MDINKSDHIVFISDSSVESKELYDTLKTEYDINVMGNMSNGLEQENILLKDVDYFSSGYVTMMNHINDSKMVVTNCPVWAMICNLMKKHMVFWGATCSQFKAEGVYGFENYNTISVDVDMKSVVDMVRYKYEGIE